MSIFPLIIDKFPSMFKICPFKSIVPPVKFTFPNVISSVNFKSDLISVVITSLTCNIPDVVNSSSKLLLIILSTSDVVDALNLSLFKSFSTISLKKGSLTSSP